jgi:hypothetical protein
MNAGVKLSGKLGRNALGFFSAIDQINNLLFPSNQGSQSASLLEDVTSGVLRYRRDVGRGSTFGLLYTGRAAENYHNHVAGFDGFFRFSPTKSLRFQYLHSETGYPQDLARGYGQPEAGFGGDAFIVDLLHFGRDWGYELSYEDLSPEFRADYGYIPRVDMRKADAVLHRILWGKQGGWFTQLLMGVSGEVIYNHNGRLTDQEILVAGQYRGPLQSEFVTMLSQNKEFFLGKTYDLTTAACRGAIKPGSGLSFTLTGRVGDSVDYANAREADQTALIAGTEIGLGSRPDLLRQDRLRLDRLSSGLGVVSPLILLM